MQRFLDAWEPFWTSLIVIADGPDRYDVVDVAKKHGDVYTWADMPPNMFSRCDSAIRSFGFLKAWRAEPDIIITLDDDCYPAGEGFLNDHVDNLFHAPLIEESIPGLRTRGLPYDNRGTIDCHIRMGLWSDYCDFDAVTELSQRHQQRVPYAPPLTRRTLSHGTLFPMCGMNLAFRHEVTPLMYFPPMGDGQPFARFDDIWCGLIAKTICDHLGYRVRVGGAIVRHMKASDPFVNLVKEAPGIVENETAWETIIAAPLVGSTPGECVMEMGDHLQKQTGYWATVGAHLHKWMELLKCRS